MADRSARVGCPVCYRTYKNKRHLNRHLRNSAVCSETRIVDSRGTLLFNTPKFVCSYCSYKTFKEPFLLKHIETAHLDLL